MEPRPTVNGFLGEPDARQRGGRAITLSARDVGNETQGEGRDLEEKEQAEQPPRQDGAGPPAECRRQTRDGCDADHEGHGDFGRKEVAGDDACPPAPNCGALKTHDP